MALFRRRPEPKIESEETSAPMRSSLECVSDEYEQAEATFLARVRDGAAREVLADAARRTAVAAEEFNAEAYRSFHAGVEDAWMSLDLLTERTEVLHELWQDIALAFEA